MTRSAEWTPAQTLAARTPLGDPGRMDAGGQDSVGASADSGAVTAAGVALTGICRAVVPA